MKPAMRLQGVEVEDVRAKGALHETEARVMSPGGTSNSQPPPATAMQFVGFRLESVRRFAMRLFGCVLSMLVLGAVILWVLMSMVGVVGAFEKFMRGIGFSGFHVLSIQFVFGLVLIAAAFSAFVAAMTVVVAGLYNVLAAHSGGVEVLVNDAVAPVQVPAGASDGAVGTPLTQPSLIDRARAGIDGAVAWIAQSHERRVARRTAHAEEQLSAGPPGTTRPV